MGVQEDKFATKVTELAAICRKLSVPQILLLRRMTLSDPESLKWASEAQLKTVFVVILTEIIRAASFENLEYAAEHHFDPWLPNEPAELRDQDRWLLHDICKPLLPTTTGSVTFSTPPPPANVDVEALLAEQENEAKPFSDFNTLLDDTVERYLRKVLRVTQASSIRAYIPLPFYVAPDFADAFVGVVRQFIMPALHSNRVIKEMATSRDWSKGGAERLISIIQKGDEKENPILRQWVARWDYFSDATQAPLRARGKGVAPEDTPWAILMGDGGKKDYYPADEKYLWMVKGIIRWDAEVLAEAWKELLQIYGQEFNPANKHDQGRPGSFRDALVRWIGKLDHYSGEVLTVKAFFELAKCDKLFMNNVAKTFGLANERAKAVPLVMDFLENLPK